MKSDKTTAKASGTKLCHINTKGIRKAVCVVMYVYVKFLYDSWQRIEGNPFKANTLIRECIALRYALIDDS